MPGDFGAHIPRGMLTAIVLRGDGVRLKFISKSESPECGGISELIAFTAVEP